MNQRLALDGTGSVKFSKFHYRQTKNQTGNPRRTKEKVRNEGKKKKKLSQDDGEKREEATVAHVCTVRSPLAY